MSAPPPIPPPMPRAPNTVAYATPSQYVSALDAPVIVDGSDLVGTPLMSLPPRCVKCNAPEDRRFTKKYQWHHPLIYLTILPGVLIYAIVALCVQKKGTCHFGLCKRHATRRRWVIFLAWTIALGSIALAIGGGMMISDGRIDEDYIPLMVLLGIFGPLIAAILGIVFSQTFRPRFIDATTMRLRGASPEFLRELADSTAPVAQAVGSFR